MKLKTLKDILKCYDCTCINEKCINHYRLKQEAIKWVKFYEGNNDIAAAGAIGHFFNITKEDLE